MADISGVLYPLQVDPQTHNLKTGIDADLIQTQIRSMLETEPGENPMRPGYGIPGAIFTTHGDGTYLSEVERRLKAEIPFADFSATGDLQDDGSLYLRIYWEYTGKPEVAGEITITIFL